MPTDKVLSFVASRRLQLAALSAVVALCLLAASVLINAVFEKLDRYSTASQDGVYWTMSQIEVDQLKLIVELERMKVAQNPDFAQLRQRFDLFYSRVMTLRNAAVYRSILDGTDVAADVQAIFTRLDEMVVMIDGDDQSLLGSRDRILSLVTSMTTPIRDIAIAGISVGAARADGERNVLTQQIITLTVLTIMMLSALFLALLLVWRLYEDSQRQAEQSRNTTNRLTTILNTSQDGILVVGPSGEVQDTNGAADRMFALPQADKSSVPISNFLFRTDPDGGLTPLTGRRLLAECEQGSKRFDDLVVRSLDGREFPAEISADIARRGEMSVCICFVRDLSERLAAEAEIVSARDRALSGERAKARFLGMISHEMRTPLHGILGALDLLHDTGLTSEQERYAKVMKSSGQMLLTQISDALDMTQVGAGKMVLRRDVFDLDGMLQELVENQQALARAQNNKLELLIAKDGLGRVEGDRGRIYQVLLNVVSNAIKYTQNGQITIEAARAASSPDVDPIVEFQISDTGVGISEENLARVFDDFVRVGSSDANQPEGTGLGLGIARHLVTLMGGEIGAESLPGEGSLFWTRIPLPVKNRAPPAPRAETAPAVIAPLDVLVVEDNANNRLVIEAMLKNDGHRVTLACDGVEGVAFAAETLYDLILMDINMPRMDGIEATRRIRADNGASSSTRIVALTAHFSSDKATELRAAGMDAVETKPLRRATLRDILAGIATTMQAHNPSIVVDNSMLSQLGTSLSMASIIGLLDRFQAEGTQIIADLDTLHAMPPEVLADRLHGFSGSAATTGAVALQAILEQAETALRQGDKDTAAHLLKELPKIWTDTMAHLSARHRAA
ncbi:PAS domain S-box-containing protein [Roseovarius marisflavi]|uniref:histidine kinase n=1 Tax=Roseovarius marisflavi TaxID=1054996 RepID=A0A1M6VIL5_9RHOB|nr:ATP-binding protein [Roseovarius marisflavi]SHK81353.1 PAS domain S-box-containing protein [Roseovarius marisflavi]